MTTETILLILFAGVLAMAVAVFMYGYRSRLRSSLKWTLGILRFLSVFALLILIINPQLRSTSYTVKKSKMVLLTDNSESITELGAAGVANDMTRQLKGDQKLNERFDITALGFGADLNLNDSLSFNEASTNLGKALAEIKSSYPSQRTAVVLLTDGNQTVGSDYEFYSSGLSMPVFPIVMGDTTHYADLAITRVNSNRYAFLKNSFPVEALVTYDGQEPVTTLFRIRQGNSILYSEQLRFEQGSNSAVINLNIEAKAVGVQRYTAELLPLENEKNGTNNSRQFAVEVIDQATNIFLVRSLVHPDIGTLRKSIEQNKQRKLSIMSPGEAITALADCQLLIAYQPDRSFRELFKRASDLGINQFLVCGRKTDWNFLNSIQDDYYKEQSVADEETGVLFNRNFSVYGTSDIGFEDFPPLRTTFGELTVLRPHQVLLEQVVDGITTEQPTLALLDDNAQRSGILDGEGIWKWRGQSYLNDGNFTAFDTFISGLMQYLASTKRRKRLDINSEAFYYNNNPVRISAQYFDKNYVFDPTAELRILVSPEAGGESQEFPMLLKDSYFEVDLSALEAGEYQFTIMARDQPVSGSGSFSVLDFGIERQFLRANVEKLERTAQNTGGQLYFPDQFSTMVGNLMGDDRFKQVQESQTKVVPLIEWSALLGILAFLLAVEWIVRKYNGLV